MTEVYIVLDETNNSWVSMSSDMITSVSDAKQHHENTKHEIHIYRSVLVGMFKQEELTI